MGSPLRRLEGVTYWVIEDPNDIYDFINTNIRKEWEMDFSSVGLDSKEYPWLLSLLKRKWKLKIIGVNEVKLNLEIMDYKDPKTGYVFAHYLAERRKDMRRAIEVYSAVTSPVIVRGEDMMLMDGYCRYTTLKEMGVPKVYAYVGSLVSTISKDVY